MVQCSMVLLTKRPECGKLEDAAFQTLKSNEHIDYRLWNFRACFMTSTIYSSSAKTIVVSELKSTLRGSSHLSASSPCSEVKMRCENTQSLSIVYRTRTVLRILLGLQIIHFSLFCMKNYRVWLIVEGRESKGESRKCQIK